MHLNSSYTSILSYALAVLVRYFCFLGVTNPKRKTFKNMTPAGTWDTQSICLLS